MTAPLSPLRILHLTGASDAGGLSRYLLDLSHGLLSRGHQVTIAGQRGLWHDRFTAAGIPWIDLPLRGGPLALRRSAAWLQDYLTTHPTDILHTHYRKPTLVARRATKQKKIPIVYTVHQPRIRLTGPWRWLSDFGDHTHAPSQDARRWLLETARIPDDRITVIPHGVDPALFPQRTAADKSAARASLGLADSDLVLAFVGRLDVPKNAAWILDCATALLPRPNVKTIIAGDGPEMPDLRRAVQQRGLTNRVFLLGECPVLPVYQAADILLIPSQREGFSLVCAEAMSVGVPVLRTNTGGAEEMIRDKCTGWTVPVDRHAFVAAANELSMHPDRLSEMGPLAARHIRENFTLDRQIDQTIELYHHLCRVGVPAHR